MNSTRCSSVSSSFPNGVSTTGLFFPSSGKKHHDLNVCAGGRTNWTASSDESAIIIRNCQILPTAPKAGTRSDWRLLMACWLLTEILANLPTCTHIQVRESSTGGRPPLRPKRSASQCIPKSTCSSLGEELRYSIREKSRCSQSAQEQPLIFEQR